MSENVRIACYRQWNFHKREFRKLERQYTATYDTLTVSERTAIRRRMAHCQRVLDGLMEIAREYQLI